MSKQTKATPSRAQLVQSQARHNADMVADAIAERKLGFMNDQGGPTAQPQSLTGRAYRGYNALVAESFAASLNSDSMQFGTAGQFNKHGFRIRAGERGVSLVGTTSREFRVVHNKETDLPEIDADGRMKRELVTLDKPRASTYVVYHASQVEAIEPEQKPELPAPAVTKRNTHPREAPLRLAEELRVPIHRTGDPVVRAGKDGLTMPASEAIGNASAEGREIVSGIADYLHQSGGCAAVPTNSPGSSRW